MREDLEYWLESFNDLVKQYPVHFAVSVIAVLALIFFWRTLLIILKGLFYAGIALAIILVAILIVVKLKYRQVSLKDLFREKKKLLHGIKIAEKKYLRRKLSEKDFNKIFKEKQRKLIAIEAHIDQLYNKESSEKVNRELLAVQTKKRHILKILLSEKKRVIKELDIAEKRYLRRKIDVKTYQELVHKNQLRLIELEAEIKELYNEANVSKVMTNLKKVLSGAEKKKKLRKKKKAVSEKEKQVQIAKDIAEQISDK